MLCRTPEWDGTSRGKSSAAESRRLRITTKLVPGRVGRIFVPKVNVALKELVETRGWLKFVILTALLPAKRTAVLVDECDQLCRILGKSIATAKAAKRAGLREESNQPVSITNNKFSMTNSQSSRPKT